MEAPSTTKKKAAVTVVIAVMVMVAMALVKSGSAQIARERGVNTVSSSNATPPAEASVTLSPSQLGAIKIETVGTYFFPEEKEAVGGIEFDGNRSTPVFPPSPGKLLQAFAELGDRVRKGQVLYTIDSPDLVQAESTLVANAATLDLTTKELQRAKELFSTNVGVSERELEQAVNDQQAAQGALNAARRAVGIFGKSDQEVDQIVAQRKIDSALAVSSPMNGEITAFDAAPGELVQPGATTAPFTVADTSVKWMVANVVESDAALYRVDETLTATVPALAGRTFSGKIAKVYPSLDATTHRLSVRCEIPDPKEELRPGMLANFVIRVREPVESTALPINGVARNGDGTYAAWTTTDRHRFTRRLVKLGLTRDGRDQILEGLQPGELAVTDGAIFLSNLLEAPPSD